MTAPEAEPGTGVRVTANLSGRATAAMTEIGQLTGDTKTEAINKALQLYVLVQRAQQAGGGLWIQDSAASDPVEYRFL